MNGWFISFKSISEQCLSMFVAPLCVINNLNIINLLLECVLKITTQSWHCQDLTQIHASCYTRTPDILWIVTTQPLWIDVPSSFIFIFKIRNKPTSPLAVDLTLKLLVIIQYQFNIIQTSQALKNNRQRERRKGYNYAFQDCISSVHVLKHVKCMNRRRDCYLLYRTFPYMESFVGITGCLHVRCLPFTVCVLRCFCIWWKNILTTLLLVRW